MSIAPRNLFVLAAVGLLLLGFLAAMIVSRPVEEPRETSGLRAGDHLPEIGIHGTDGMNTGLKAFTRDGDLVILVLDLESASCMELLESFGAPTAPDEARLIGMCDCELADAQRYRETRSLGYPIYADTGSSFIEVFPFKVFPAVIGVRRGGDIAFVWQGANDEFTYARARDLIRSSYEDAP